MRLQGKTVLVADDEAGIREFIRDELEYEGAKVLEASNGAEAARLISETHVDVLISDIRMPGGDGIQLVKDLKTREDAHVPVVMFMTAFNDLPPAMANQLGINTIYPKPFDLSAMVSRVAEVLKSPGS